MVAPSVILKALIEIGPRSLVYYLLYQLGLHSGYYRWRTPPKTLATAQQVENPELVHFTLRHGVIHLPAAGDLMAVLGAEGVDQLISQADEVAGGLVRLFGCEPIPFHFSSPQPPLHWTQYEKRQTTIHGKDIRRVWEIGRFGWTYLLGRAYHICRDERYSDAFWRYAEAFLSANPTNIGPHWVSGQEIALRLIALAFAAEVFADSKHTTELRARWLGEAIAEHANRIPLTLVYALAQNNNHLLVEAAGLFTAGLILDQHPKAAMWRKRGVRLFRRGLTSQISQDGTYTQHSTNYHRVMLQIALWMWMLDSRNSDRKTPVFSPSEIQRLAAATRWLLALLDEESGRVPNLGPNDGAYILPMTISPLDDYRPVLQSASQAFLRQDAFPAGVWDEMSLWFNLRRVDQAANAPFSRQDLRTSENLQNTPHVLRSDDSHAYLRVARFSSRPGHADLLHVDLWWRGLNLAQDAGSYLYNAPPPWDNSLNRTAVHNTITINDRDQMERAGRFLWLNWAKSRVISYEHDETKSWERLITQHDGYRRTGVLHQRALEHLPKKWLVTDTLLPMKDGLLQPKKVKVRLHWLLPDWDWQVEQGDLSTSYRLRLKSPFGWIALDVGVQPKAGSILPQATLLIERAGVLVYGSGEANPTHGWVSPTYAYKTAALSVSLVVIHILPISLTTEWHLL